MPRTTAETAPIRLTWNEKNRQVVISPKDNDLHVLTVEEVISALGAEGASARATAQLQFRALLNKLGEWNRKHGDKQSQVLLTLRDTNLLFLVVMKGRAHDPQLEDDLTELDLSIAQDDAFDKLSVSVLAIPHCDKDCIKSFVNDNLCYTYVGET